MATFIDGIGASENIDSSGERISVAGMDISSLAVDGVFNWEHEAAKDQNGQPITVKMPAQIVGKVLKAKKIFTEKDCQDERESYFWQKCQVPFVYVMGELFDDYKESARDVAGMFRYDMDKKGQQERNVMNFSIEGAKIHKEGIDVTKSIARKVTITVLPCNKAAIAEMVPAKGAKPTDDLDSLFKTETSIEIELFKAEDMPKFMDNLKKAANLKLVPPAAPANPLGTHVGKTGSGKDVFSHQKIGNYPGFSSQDHKDAANLHYNAIKDGGDIKTNQHHMGKMKLHMQASQSAEKRESRFAVGKQMAAQRAGEIAQQANKQIPGFDRGGTIKKSMTAGSANASPGQLSGGAALAPQSLDKKLHKDEKADSVVKIPKQEFVNEHKELVDTLKHPSKKKVKKEIKEQSGELKAMTKAEQFLERAKEEYSNWDKKDTFQRFMQEKYPKMTKTEADVVGQTLALKLSIEAEKALSKLTKK